MKRIALATTLGLLGVLLSVMPASAQYGGEPPPPPPAPPSGCPVEDPPPDDTPPCNPRRPLSVSDDDVAPGDPVTVTTPPVFAPASETAVNLVRARQGANATVLGTPTAGSNGSVSDTFAVPDVPPGIYFLYVTGVDTDGNLIVSLNPIVIRGAGAQAAAVEGDTFEASAAGAPVVAAAAAVPAAVADLQSVESDVEAAVVDAVADGAGVALSPQGVLQVRTAAGVLQDADSLPVTGASDISEQVTIGAALLLAGTGMVLLRRRRGGFTK